MELARLQSLLYRLITAPGGVAEGLANEQLGEEGLEGVIRSDARLSAHERLEIYANAYFYRLLEVCREDFPATVAVLGDAHFHNLITGYLLEYPPTEPSIDDAGRHLADFLRGHPLSADRPFLADLATLERIMVEVFRAADAVPLEPAAMRSLEPAEWPALKLGLHPASRILDLEWHVEQMVEAIADGAAPPVPARGPLKLIVWRRDSRVRYREVEPDEATALEIARTGPTFATICEALAQANPAAEPAPLITRMLGRWVAAGLLIRRAASA